MKTVRASCPDCGDIDTNTNELRIVTYTNLHLGENDISEYHFRCPVCKEMIVKQIENERVLDTLLRENVDRDYVSQPKIDLGYGEPVNHDEVIDFHKMTSNDEEFDKAMQEFLTD